MISDDIHSGSKADATGLDPVEEADISTIKTTGRRQASFLIYKNLQCYM
jgi:hypothetical protein